MHRSSRWRFIGISFAFAWMRLRSGSLWTGAFLHASHNMVIQSILTPLTIDTGKTKWVIDEFGCALPIRQSLRFWRAGPPDRPGCIPSTIP